MNRSYVGRVPCIQRSIWLASVAFGLGLICFPTLSWGHAKSVSYSNWQFEESTLRVSVRVSLLELSRLPLPLPVTGRGSDTAALQGVGEYLSRHLMAFTDEGPCSQVDGPRSRPTEKGWLLFGWTLRCPDGADVVLRSDILIDQAPSHMHFARTKFPAQEPGQRPRILERVLTETEPNWTLPQSEDGFAAQSPDLVETASGTSFLSYLNLGIRHILSGWDHLAFVLALVLLARNLRELATLVTGFTLAHSLTLGLAVLGWIEPHATSIEAVIGFSVALLAAENNWILGGRGRLIPTLATLGLLAMGGLALAHVGQIGALTLFGLALFSFSHFETLKRAVEPHLHRMMLAFAFGLVHGFGFAGVLAELSLPPQRLVPALLGFNLGVEIGQLAIVALIWPALLFLRSHLRAPGYRLLTEIASASICGLGLFWFLTRAYSP